VKKRVFFLGFGVSAVLIAVCVSYACTHSAVVMAFDPTVRGWYVHQPTGYNACLLAFTVLNLPAVLLCVAIVSGIDTLVVLTAAQRTALTFGILITLSSGWWALVALWREKRGRTKVSAAH
jgi:hypothetical protein